MLNVVAAVLLLMFTVSAGSSDGVAPINLVTQGMSRADLVATMGEPLGRMRMGAKDVLMFKDGDVELVRDKVVSVSRSSGSRPVNREKAAPPTPAPVAAVPQPKANPAQVQPEGSLPVTMGHEILRLESRFGAKAKHQASLDLLLQRARKALPVASQRAGGDEARSCLVAIQKFLKKEGFRYQTTAFLFEALETRNSDCDTSTLLYCAIGEVMGYPLGAVVLPRHAFVRWILPHGGVLNWETTEDGKSASFSDGTYYDWLLKGATGEGCNLRTLTREQLPAIHHYMAGLALAAGGKYDEAMKEHDAALGLDKGWYLSLIEKSEIELFRKSYAAGANQTLKAMEYLPVDEVGQVAATAVAFAIVVKQEQDVDLKQLGRILNGFMRHDSDSLGYVVLNAMDAYLSDRASSGMADLDGACAKWPTNFVPFICRGALYSRGGNNDRVRQDFTTALKLMDTNGVKRGHSPLR